jgi:CheY-like chemotaxis protein
LLYCLLPLQQLDKKLFADEPVLLPHAGDDAIHLSDKKQGRLRDTGDGKKPTVLLVEDNDDFRFYIKDNLKDSFNIIEAENGKKGWQKALAQHPNLVVSDITMPEMNGIDLCLKIKSDKRTTHIPVILLTAIAGEEQQTKRPGHRRQRLYDQAFQLRDTGIQDKEHPEPAGEHA